MLYDFKCRATGPVVMTQKVGERILQIIGKEPARTGIVTVAQMPEAIRALETAVEEERALQAAQPPEEADEDDDERTRKPEPVTLGQRAWPFIAMLKEALAAERDITWGV